MKVGDFLNTLAGKAGKTEEIKAVLNNAALATIEIDDTLANDINSSLLTLDGAKNNQGLKTHFNTLALNGVDAEILNAIEALGFDETVKTELLGEKNTYNKHRKLTSKIKETIDALKAATQKDDTKAIEKYTAQINKLQGELATVKESHVPKSEIETLKKQHESDLTNFIVKNTLSTRKYANEAVPADVNIELANIMISRALAEKGIVLVKDGANLKLKQAADPALDYYDGQQKAVAFGDFVDKILADAKILAVSNSKQTPPTRTPVAVPPNYLPNFPNGPIPYDNSAAVNNAVAGLAD
ncbi:MAG: hypothetical protein LBS43_12540 [Prevotellaceae bacterium]|jgi:hypothetical protein|nr:hypothetical protein [Prevotellaceae bacterium]